MVDNKTASTQSELTANDINLYQSAELAQVLTSKASNGEVLTLEIIQQEVKKMHERDCIPEEVDQEIYDYENPVACLTRNSDFKERVVI